MNEKDRINNIYSDYLRDNVSLKKWSKEKLSNQLIEKERFQAIKNLFQINSINLKNKMVIDIGCAGGNIMPILKKFGAAEKNLHGIDLREDRLSYAKKRFPKSNFNLMDARNIKFNDSSFDMVISFTLFSSVLNIDYRKQIAREMVRVLKPRGVILYYDFRYNNPFNRNVMKVRYKDMKSLFPNMKMELTLITVLPPLVRLFGGLAKYVYPILSKIPFLYSHHIGLIKKDD